MKRTAVITELTTNTHDQYQTWTIAIAVLRPNLRWPGALPDANDLPQDVREALITWLTTAQDNA